jgi:hypothetical protein
VVQGSNEGLKAWHVARLLGVTPSGKRGAALKVRCTPVQLCWEVKRSACWQLVLGCRQEQRAGELAPHTLIL